MICALCHRDVPKTSRHHLIPRSRHKRSKASREEKMETVDFCGCCHHHVHATLSETELLQVYNTLDALLAHDGIAKFVKWIAKKPGEFRAPRKTKKRR